MRLTLLASESLTIRHHSSPFEEGAWASLGLSLRNILSCRAGEPSITLFTPFDTLITPNMLIAGRNDRMLSTSSVVSKVALQAACFVRCVVVKRCFSVLMVEAALGAMLF